MKTILTLLSVCISYAVFASHHMGGYIAAKQLNGHLYQITTVLLSDPNSPANAYSDSISLEYGDGQTEKIIRTSVSTEDGVQRNTYTTQHQYSTDGTFLIVYTSPNLPANIVNVNGGFSDNVPFKTTCLIRISSTLYFTSQSANPLAFEFVKGYTEKITHYNPTFVGGDSITVLHELVTDYPSLTNYTLPEGSSINPYSGMIAFTPKSPGLYLFMIRVSSYSRYGILVAQSCIPQLCKITDGISESPTVDFMLASLHPQGWYSRELVPNQNIDQQANFTGVSGSYSVELYSELFDKGATHSIIELMPNSVVTAVNWTALAEYERTTPYFITYRFRRSTENIITDYNIAFYHGAPINTGIHDQASSDEYIIVYPNPAYGTTQCFFVFNNVHQAQLLVYDALGRMITTQSVNGKSITVETSAWKSGMYTYTLLMENGEVQNGKLILK